jgi:hypothetical protein
VIIDDFHFVTMAITPNKTDSPSIVDPNRVLPFAIASQSFQLIAGRRRQNVQLRGGVKLEQLPDCNPLDSAKTLAVLVMKKLLGFFGAEALDHT